MKVPNVKLSCVFCGETFWLHAHEVTLYLGIDGDALIYTHVDRVNGKTCEESAREVTPEIRALFAASTIRLPVEWGASIDEMLRSGRELPPIDDRERDATIRHLRLVDQSSYLFAALVEGAWSVEEAPEKIAAALVALTRRDVAEDGTGEVQS